MSSPSLEAAVVDDYRPGQCGHVIRVSAGAKVPVARRVTQHGLRTRWMELPKGPRLQRVDWSPEKWMLQRQCGSWILRVNREQ